MCSGVLEINIHTLEMPSKAGFGGDLFWPPMNLLEVTAFPPEAQVVHEISFRVICQLRAYKPFEVHANTLISLQCPSACPLTL